VDITAGDDFQGLCDKKKLISIWVLFSMVMEWWVSYVKCAPVKHAMHVTLCDLEQAGGRNS